VVKHKKLFSEGYLVVFRRTGSPVTPEKDRQQRALILLLTALAVWYGAMGLIKIGMVREALM
jgi:hypothetical protein